MTCRLAHVVVFALVLSASGAAQNPEASDPFAPPPELLERGAPVRIGDFRHRRALPEGDPGLVTLALDAPVLSRSRGPSSRFADVRIVTADGQQIPYLLERRDEPLALELELRPSDSRAARSARPDAGRRSVYELQLPEAGLPDMRVELSTPDRVFRRPVTIGAERDPDREHRDIWFEPLASDVWQHAGTDTAAPPLALRVSPRAGTRRLLLVVDEGDNRPLALDGARLLLPSWRLRFYRPEGPLQLAYGNDTIAQPAYDLALVAPAVLAAEAEEIQAAPGDSPEAAPARLISVGVFWVGLGVAALALLALIVRLLRPPVSFR